MRTIVVVLSEVPEEAGRSARTSLPGSRVRVVEVDGFPGAAIGASVHGGRDEAHGDDPLAVSSCGTIQLALDGEIANRAELAQALGEAERTRPSDATLFLRAWERWGEAALGRIDGRFAVAIVDARRRRVVLARDPIGDRTLFYWAEGGRLVAASTEGAVIGQPGFPREPDDARLAAMLGQQEPAPGATFFRHLKEVAPAQIVCHSEGRVVASRYWEPAPVGRGLLRTDDDWAEAFVDRLDRAVGRCLPDGGRTGVFLSGGLDSCPIAALAARRLAPATLTAISWVFDELTSCDERRYVDDVARAWRLEKRFIRSDALWPLSGFETWPVAADRPEHDGFRRLILEGYGVAREMGITTVLSGFAGDHLYIGAGDWLVALLREGRLGDAFAAFSEAVREAGAWRAVRSLVISPLAPRSLRRRPRPRPWLTPYATELLRANPRAGGVLPHRERQRAAVLSEWTASCSAREVRRAGDAGIDLRYPFRDREVVELALSLPSHQLERGWTTRPVVRRGFGKLLPSSVVERPGKTLLGPLSDRGMFGPGRGTLLDLLSRKDPIWSRFVDPAWVFRRLERSGGPESELAAIWHCAFVDLWARRVLE